MARIENLKTASGKEYPICIGGMKPGARQYLDREYPFGEVPPALLGQTYIMTAGNDKLYEEDEKCMRFTLLDDAVVYVLHGNTFEVRPQWLEREFEKTEMTVTRPLEADDRNMSFSVFARRFSAGEVVLMGDLPKGFLTPPFRNSGGAGYCMYSVVVGDA